MTYFRFIALNVLLCGWGTAVGQTQEPLPQSAMQKINQASITATVKFLSSDELAGRDTPSPGLDKACDYVRDRFKQTGLEPLGTEGTYFHTTQIATIQHPQTASIKSAGRAVEVLGVLSAGEKAFQYSGSIVTVDEHSDRNASYTGPVTLAADPFTKRRNANNFFNKIQRLQQHGATACLAQVDRNHSLVAEAKRAAQPRLAQILKNIAGPVVLVPPTKFQEVAIQLDAQRNAAAEVKNVIGLLRGSDPQLAKQAIIFSAHLDHIGTSGLVGDTINNGADDDASGVTAVLTLADAYAALTEKPKRSVIFMTFWGEEKGLLGSRHYATSPTWPLKQTVANLNLEMLGRPEAGASGKAWMTGWSQSDLGPLMKQGADRAGVLIFEHPKLSSFLYRRSDNWPLVEKGVIAHSFSAGSLHADYHQPSDEWQKLRLDHMTRVVQGLFAGSLPIANGGLTPQKSPQRRPDR